MAGTKHIESFMQIAIEVVESAPFTFIFRYFSVLFKNFILHSFNCHFKNIFAPMRRPIQKGGGNIPVIFISFSCFVKKEKNVCFVTVISKYTNFFNSFKIIIDHIYITLIIFANRW